MWLSLHAVVPVPKQHISHALQHNVAWLCKLKTLLHKGTSWTYMHISYTILLSLMLSLPFQRMATFRVSNWLKKCFMKTSLQYMYWLQLQVMCPDDTVRNNVNQYIWQRGSYGCSHYRAAVVRSQQLLEWQVAWIPHHSLYMLQHTRVHC